MTQPSPAAEPRHTADTTTSNALNQLHARAEKAEAERDAYRDAWHSAKDRARKAHTALAALHEGEQPRDDERIVPTPGQWIWQWNRATPEQRLEFAARLISGSERADRCVLEHHPAQIEQLKDRAAQAEAAIDRVRTYAADLDRAGWTQAAIARRIRAALDEPHNQPATTGHDYLSTGCLHGRHDYCNNTRGIAGPKTPAQCKFCAAQCVCHCHSERPHPDGEQPAASARPVHPDGTPYRYSEIAAEGWEHCDGCGQWGRGWTSASPHDCPNPPKAATEE
ncbi:hypothetical protein OG393_30870 [Streptomyces sp. NBC_01216]|uniref:hypothetical protein n=1 Tax=Streptomyces sp. NBC_01216 TaxID=2903778 RepID=UPI002E162124|nr:hypothetical protein OG393_30870 [Streptomyces sp. NBC_01216]